MTTTRPKRTKADPRSNDEGTGAADAPADDSGGHTQRQRTRERGHQITEMLLAGMSILDIGQQFGAATRGSATRLVERALSENLPGFDPVLARRLDSARLDQLLHVWWDRATELDPLASLIVVAIIDTRAQLDPEHHHSAHSTDTPEPRDSLSVRLADHLRQHDDRD